MATPARVHVDVDEVRHTGPTVTIADVGERHGETRLLLRLAQRRLPRRLTRIDVTTGLEPESEPLVLQQQHTARTDDDRRAGHVHRVEFLIERVGQSIELGERSFDRPGLVIVDRVTFRDGSADEFEQVVTHVFTVSRRNFVKALEFPESSTDTAIKPILPASARERIMEPHDQFAPRVLLAIDDLRLRRTNEAGLRSAGFAVSAPSDADAVQILAESFSPDVLVIDTDMEGPDHKPLYQRLRDGTDSYLLCIDAAGRDRARVELLRFGADDAVSVPVTPDEIVARCHALMRRPREIRRAEWDGPQQSVITLGPLVVDTGRHEIRLGDEEVQATRIEFSLLEHLCRRPTEVASRSELLESVWGPNWVGDTHVVDVHLSNLRRKLDKADDSLRVVHTVRGVGFRISNEILDAAEAQVTSGVPVTTRDEPEPDEREPEPASSIATGTILG